MVLGANGAGAVSKIRAKKLIVNGRWLVVKHEKASCNNHFD